MYRTVPYITLVSTRGQKTSNFFLITKRPRKTHKNTLGRFFRQRFETSTLGVQNCKSRTHLCNPFYGNGLNRGDLSK